jgi:hypothetical protein
MPDYEWFRTPGILKMLNFAGKCAYGNETKDI